MTKFTCKFWGTRITACRAGSLQHLGRWLPSPQRFNCLAQNQISPDWGPSALTSKCIWQEKKEGDSIKLKFLPGGSSKSSKRIVCVHVCVCERERERDGRWYSLQSQELKKKKNSQKTCFFIDRTKELERISRWTPRSNWAKREMETERGRETLKEITVVIHSGKEYLRTDTSLVVGKCVCRIINHKAGKLWSGKGKHCLSHVKGCLPTEGTLYSLFLPRQCVLLHHKPLLRHCRFTADERDTGDWLKVFVSEVMSFPWNTVGLLVEVRVQGIS